CGARVRGRRRRGCAPRSRGCTTCSRRASPSSAARSRSATPPGAPTGPRRSTSSAGASPRSLTCGRCSATSRTPCWREDVARIIAIDLGTTYSLVAVREAGGPRVLADPATGAVLLPSAVAFLDDGSVVVGERARALAAERPLDTLLSVKRFMGLGLEHVSDED